MHERWSRGEDLHNRAISLSPSAHMFIIFTPPPTPTPSLVRVYRTNPSPVINSPASLARVKTLSRPSSSLHRLSYRDGSNSRNMCVYMWDFSCRSCHERLAASGELTRRLPPDPVDSEHPGLSWCTCRAAPPPPTWRGQKSGRSGC